MIHKSYQSRSNEDNNSQYYFTENLDIRPELTMSEFFFSNAKIDREKNYVLQKTCAVCYRNFQKDPGDHEKNGFKNIV